MTVMTLMIDTFGTDMAQAIGFLGFLFYVVAYLALTFRLLSAERPLFFALQAMAAFCVLIGLGAAFNLAAAMIQVFFLVISLVGVVVRVWPAIIPLPRSGAPVQSGPRSADGFPETGSPDRARC